MPELHVVSYGAFLPLYISNHTHLAERTYLRSTYLCILQDLSILTRPQATGLRSRPFHPTEIFLASFSTAYIAYSPKSISNAEI